MNEVLEITINVIQWVYVVTFSVFLYSIGAGLTWRIIDKVMGEISDVELPLFFWPITLLVMLCYCLLHLVEQIARFVAGR